jgi:hypothetical protein
VYTSFQPALQQQRDEKEGKFQTQHGQPVDPSVNRDTAISDAIRSDFKDAKREVIGEIDKTKFAWGIRQALFGPKPSAPSDQEPLNQANQTEGKTGSEPSQISKPTGPPKT